MHMKSVCKYVLCVVGPLMCALILDVPFLCCQRCSQDMQGSRSAQTKAWLQMDRHALLLYEQEVSLRFCFMCFSGRPVGILTTEVIAQNKSELGLQTHLASV